MIWYIEWCTGWSVYVNVNRWSTLFYGYNTSASLYKNAFFSYYKFQCKPVFNIRKAYSYPKSEYTQQLSCLNVYLVQCFIILVFLLPKYFNFNLFLFLRCERKLFRLRELSNRVKQKVEGFNKRFNMDLSKAIEVTLKLSGDFSELEDDNEEHVQTNEAYEGDDDVR